MKKEELVATGSFTYGQHFFFLSLSYSIIIIIITISFFFSSFFTFFHYLVKLEYCSSYISLQFSTFTNPHPPLISIITTHRIFFSPLKVFHCFIGGSELFFFVKTFSFPLIIYTIKFTYTRLLNRLTILIKLFAFLVNLYRRISSIKVNF